MGYASCALLPALSLQMQIATSMLTKGLETCRRIRRRKASSPGHDRAFPKWLVWLVLHLFEETCCFCSLASQNLQWRFIRQLTCVGVWNVLKSFQVCSSVFRMCQCVKAEVEQKQPALLQEKDSLQQQLQQAQQAHGNAWHRMLTQKSKQFEGKTIRSIRLINREHA